MKYKQINRDTTMSNFLSWLNKKGAVFPDIYFQKYKKWRAWSTCKNIYSRTR